MEIRNTHILACVIHFQSLLSVVYLWLYSRIMNFMVATTEDSKVPVCTGELGTQI